MALPSSGTITLAMIQTEFGGSNPISLSEYYRGGAYVPNTTANAGVPTSGAISLSNFYGASAYTTISVDADWGSTTASGSATSATRTLTVPAGSGNIRVDTPTNVGGQYNLNGAGWVTATDGMVLAVSNGYTLAFRKLGAGTSLYALVYDNYNNAAIGSWYAIP